MTIINARQGSIYWPCCIGVTTPVDHRQGTLLPGVVLEESPAFQRIDIQSLLLVSTSLLGAHSSSVVYCEKGSTSVGCVNLNVAMACHNLFLIRA